MAEPIIPDTEEVKRKRGRPKKVEPIKLDISEDVDLTIYSKADKEAAIAELWRQGILSWKLKGVQKDIYGHFHGTKDQKTVVLCSRRLGKSFGAVLLATELCLRNPNIIVKYLTPKLKDAKTIIRPIMRDILEDCPTDVIEGEGVIWMEADKMYRFPNGSLIQIGGTDNGNAESVRGGKAHLVICDEAGFMDDFKYIVRAILSPTLKTTRGRMLIISTPSRFPTHEFMTDFVFPAEAEGSLVKYTIYDNPMFTEEDIRQTIAEFPEGVNDPEFRREYLVETTPDAELMVINNWNQAMEEIVVQEVEPPPVCDYYVSMDVGFKDLTAVIFAYYDYMKATFVVVDELIMNGPTMTTDALAAAIRKTEELRFRDKVSDVCVAPFSRIMDNNNQILWNDLYRLHNLSFILTQKDNKDAQINNLKMMLSAGQIRIHPRCKHLIYHIKNARWNKKHTEFERLNDSPNKTVRGGHSDALDSLIYAVRNINKSKNPFPDDFFTEKGENIFQSRLNKNPAGKDTADLVHQIFGFKSKKSKSPLGPRRPIK